MILSFPRKEITYTRLNQMFRTIGYDGIWHAMTLADARGIRLTDDYRNELISKLANGGYSDDEIIYAIMVVDGNIPPC